MYRTLKVLYEAEAALVRAERRGLQRNKFLHPGYGRRYLPKT